MMKKRKLLGIALSVLTIAAGCSSAPIDGLGLRSPVTVAVSGTPDGGCSVAAPADIKVSGHESPVLKWQLSDPGKYKFAQNGIAFDKAAYQPPADEFMSQGIDAGGTFLVKDKNHTKGRFDYSIHVIVRSNNKTCEADPIIYNDGSCPPEGC